MVDWNALLERKYDQKQQQIDAETNQANAAAKYNLAQAGVVGANSAAENALRMAQARNQNVTSDLAPGLASSEIGYRGAMGNEAMARAGMTQAQTVGINDQNDFFHMLANPAIAQAILGIRGVSLSGEGGMPALGQLQPANTLGGTGMARTLSVPTQAPSNTGSLGTVGSPSSSSQGPDTASLLKVSPSRGMPSALAQPPGQYRFGMTY